MDRFLPSVFVAEGEGSQSCDHLAYPSYTTALLAEGQHLHVSCGHHYRKIDLK